MAPQPAPSRFPGLELTSPFDGVMRMCLCAPPANTLTLDLWRSLAGALAHVESDGVTRVLVISSGLGRPVFSAGNDIAELHSPSTSEVRFHDFWVTATRFLASLYASPLYTIAAVDGACPAGGCVIALCCDERFVAKEGLKMGLNEAALGISVPLFWARLMLLLGGGHRAEVERMLLTGKMVDSSDALRLGLVDYAIDGDRLMEAVDEHAENVSMSLKGPPLAGFRTTKNSLKGGFAQAWRDYAEAEATASWALLDSAKVSLVLGQLLAKLHSGKKKHRIGAKL